MSCEINKSQVLPGSFRDPSGFLFVREGTLYRQINLSYRENYEYLISSGLYNALTQDNLLIRHSEVGIHTHDERNCYKIIKPEPVHFISHPFEWCFSQLKNAALTLLRIQRISLRFGMTLKDASAYNIQFKGSSPVLIDTLSFEKYQEGLVWVAYKQFCQHFLAPLSLMSYRDARLSQLLRVFIDGIPLDLTSSLLPFTTRLDFSLLAHIHLHAGFQKFFKRSFIAKYNTGSEFSRFKLLALIDSLESAVKRLKWRTYDSEWTLYYEHANYSQEAFQYKKEAVAGFLDKIKPKTIWDIGANTGVFSRIASTKGIQVISFDMDPAAVEENYQESLGANEVNILPLLLDLTNPSPGIGWDNRERLSLLERGPTDAVLALALVHHLVISNNLPFNRIAEFFNRICTHLIIEFVPENDSWARQLLSGET